MNFTRFPANTTNIFPIANSKTGGQLLTEYNLRSRESVPTAQEVKYMIGPSYCHSMDDFSVRLLEDDEGKVVSTTTLQITSGRALVNGHFLETLVDVTVDLAEANRELQSQDMPKLEGHLGVGLRAMYSTEQTLAASLRVENNQNLMAGIQIVVLPFPEGKGQIKHGYFVTPEDTPDQEDLVSAHLLLADFWYQNGKINTIKQNFKKVQYLEASRLSNLEGVLDSDYVSLRLLNPHKLYTFSGKGRSDKEITKSTWCDSTDSLFVWQAPETITTTQTKPTLHQAEFGFDKDDPSKIVLNLPHKQIDGMRNTADQLIYFKDHHIDFPKADYAKGTGGSVSPEYTRSIHELQTRITNLYQFPSSKMRAYVETLSDRMTLPPIQQNWHVGDYVLVREDTTVSPSTESYSAPSTIYSVIPPYVESVEYVTYYYEKEKSGGYSTSSANKTKFDNLMSLGGAEVDRQYTSFPGSGTDTSDSKIRTALETAKFIDPSGSQSNKDDYNRLWGIQVESGQSSKRVRGTVYGNAVDAAVAEGENASGASVKITLEGEEYTQQDFITIVVDNVPTASGATTKLYIVYKVASTVDNSKEYSEPITLTGSIPLATEDQIGGFKNVPSTLLDNGYVNVDVNGNLVLLDYALLRSGTLAYQLGEDQYPGADLDNFTIQEFLDEYVNDRVAFPTQAQLERSIQNNTPENQIVVTLDLIEGSEPSSIDIKNIDSRWGTYVTLKLTGRADVNTTINISNCEKIKIDYDMNFTEQEIAQNYGPVINVYNSGLYYDDFIIDYIRSCKRDYGVALTTNSLNYPSGFTGIENMSLWYERFDSTDANLVVDGLTVTEIDTPVVPEDFDDVWSESIDNDFHFRVGLQSITFNPRGDMISCGIYIRNDTTANLSNQRSIIALPFTLPQGSAFSYPETSITRQMKITGEFVTSYPVANPTGYQIVDTKFTALTQSNAKAKDDDGQDTGNYNYQAGTMSFLIDTDTTTNYLQVGDFENGVPIDGWEPASYHVFKGWVIG